MESANGRGEPLGLKPGKANHHISFLALVGVVLVFCILFYKVISSLILPLFLATVIALLCYPFFQLLQRKLGGYPSLAAGIVTVLAILSILVPLAFVSYFGFTELHDAVLALQPSDVISPEQGTNDTRSKLDSFINLLSQSTHIKAPQLRAWLVKAGAEIEEVLYYRTMSFLGDLPGMVLGVILFIIAVYFFLKDGETIVQTWDELTPLELEHDVAIRHEFSCVCRAVVWGTLAAAVVQALFFGVGLFFIDWFFRIGITSWVFLLTLVTLIFATIPFLGAFAVWAPTALVLFLQGEYAAGITLSVYGAAVVSQVDAIVRIWVLRNTARLHPLLAFVCVFGGIQFLGILGIFVGPVVGAVMFTLLRILKKRVLEIGLRN